MPRGLIRMGTTIAVLCCGVCAQPDSVGALESARRPAVGAPKHYVRLVHQKGRVVEKKERLSKGSIRHEAGVHDIDGTLTKPVRNIESPMALALNALRIEHPMLAAGSNPQMLLEQFFVPAAQHGLKKLGRAFVNNGGTGIEVVDFAGLSRGPLENPHYKDYSTALRDGVLREFMKVEFAKNLDREFGAGSYAHFKSVLEESLVVHPLNAKTVAKLVDPREIDMGAIDWRLTGWEQDKQPRPTTPEQAMSEILKVGSQGETYGDRGAMVNLVPIGRPADATGKTHAYYVNRWRFALFDVLSSLQGRGYRDLLLDHYREKLHDVIAPGPGEKGIWLTKGGKTSFDFGEKSKVTPIMDALGAGAKKVYFFGDALEPGGNDRPVVDWLLAVWNEQKQGPCPVEAVHVTGPQGTVEAWKDLGWLPPGF